MDTFKKIAKLKKLFLRLHQILMDENELNWLPLTQSILSKINDSNATEVETFNYIRDSFRKCFAGNGSFSDFNIWRDNFYDRKKLNNELDRVNKEIFKLLGL